MPRNGQAEQTLYDVLDILEPRLNIIGEFKVDDAYQICKHDFGYGTIARCVRSIMSTMIEQNKASRIKNGHWKILKPNCKK